MEGETSLDCKQERLAAFDAHLTQTVKSGFGLLDNWTREADFKVGQAEDVSGHWDMTTLGLKMTGKALLFATIAVQKR